LVNITIDFNFRGNNMYIKHELTFDDMGDFLWGNAIDNWDFATEEQQLAAWDTLIDVFQDEIPEDTKVNDFIAFECDDIFSPKDEDYDESLKRNKLESRIKRLEKFMLHK